MLRKKKKKAINSAAKTYCNGRLISVERCVQNYTTNVLALSQQCSAGLHGPSAGHQLGKRLQMLPPELEPQNNNIAWFSVQGSKLLKLGESTARCTFCSLNTVFQQGLLIYKDSYVLWKSRFASIHSIHCHLFRSVESCSFIRLVSLHLISRSCLVTG